MKEPYIVDLRRRWQAINKSQNRIIQIILPACEVKKTEVLSLYDNNKLSTKKLDNYTFINPTVYKSSSVNPDILSIILTIFSVQVLEVACTSSV